MSLTLYKIFKITLSYSEYPIIYYEEDKAHDQRLNYNTMWNLFQESQLKHMRHVFVET